MRWAASPARSATRTGCSRLLAQLGRDHRRFGVRAEHYDVFGRALVAALRYHAKDVWVPELEDAWNKALRAWSPTR